MSDRKSMAAAVDAALSIGAMAERDRYVTARDKLRDCESRLAKAEAQRDVGIVALRTIAKGEGQFSRNPFTHAVNTIEDMKAVAQAALASMGVEP